MSRRDDPATGPVVEPLTRREREILTLLGQGYSAPEIAQQLTIATSSVKSHIQHLYGKLGANSKRQAIARAHELGLLQPAPGLPAVKATPQGSEPKPKYNLPQQVTRFFGRETEIEQLKKRLAEHRLVTLTGSGGVGKTRLLLRVAEEVLDDFTDGAWFVELAAQSDSALVPQQVAAVLGVRDEPGRPIHEGLAAFLRGRQALLMLDNCEHLLEACARLADGLLRACPRLQIMVSSREPLAATGEAVYRVPSLPFPDSQQPQTIESLADYAAVRLFVDRACLVLPDYKLAAHNSAALAHICRRLDGIPLAIEMAAARVNILTAEQLASRLDNAFHVLTGGSRTALPRQQTLRATIDWSYALLTEEERLLLQRLSVFAGGCTLEAAEVVCSGQGIEAGQVLEAMSSLVTKSMVLADRRQGEQVRYHLLEMVRQYAREKLDAAGGSQRLARRHWEYFLHFAETNGRRLWAKERPAWVTQFEADFDNMRLALQWSFGGLADSEAGLRLAIALQQFWFLREWGESRRWMAKGINQCQSGAAISPALKANFLAWASANRWCAERSRALAEESLAISRQLGPEDKETLCWSLWIMAVAGCYLEILPEDWARSEGLLDEQDAIIPALGPDAKIEPDFYRAYNLWLRAELANYRGQYERARAFGLDSVRIFESGFHDVHLVLPYTTLGDTALRTGDYNQARSYFADALRLADVRYDIRHSDTLALLCETETRQGNLAQAFEYCKTYIRLGNGINPHSLMCLETAARIFARAGQYSEAARLSSAAETLSQKIGRQTSTNTSLTSYWGDWRTRPADVSLDALVTDWRARPDGAAILQAWNEGRAMTYDQAIAYALDELVI